MTIYLSVICSWNLIKNKSLRSPRNQKEHKGPYDLKDL